MTSELIMTTLDRGAHTVLVVDDNPVTRYSTARVIRAAGFQTVEAGTGGEGLALAGQGVSAVVLDVHLPDMDGFTVCATIRSRPPTQALPVIHLSAAYVKNEDHVAGLNAGADAYLVHPVEPAVLVASLQALIRARAAELKLRQSEERLRSLVEASAQIFWQSHPTQGMAEVSPTWRAFTGQRDEEYLGFGWLDALHPEDRDRVDAEWREGRASGREIDIEYRLRRHDGVYRWTAARSVPLLNADGSVREWIGMNADITDRKVAEGALEDARRRLEAALSVAEVGTWTWDLRSQAIFADGNLARMFELPYMEQEGWPPSRFFDALLPQDAVHLRQVIEQACASRAAWQVDVRFRREGATDRVLQMRGKPEYDAKGQPVLLPSVAIDVTAQHRAAEQLRKFADDLAAINQRQGEFLATLAHELRNPLAPLRSGLDLLRLNRGDAASTERVRTIMDRQLDHLVHLVDDLLDLARINRGKIELQRVRVSLQEVVQRAIETSHPQVEAKRHKLDVHMPAEPIWLEADVNRMAQVIGNILTNAAKYTPPGGRIALRVEQSDGEARVDVSDNGVGIPAAALESIFDIFTQVDPVPGQAQGGLGIGLSLVRRLTEMHGGSVSASSEGAGRGSTFTLRLPLAR